MEEANSKEKNDSHIPFSSKKRSLFEKAKTMVEHLYHNLFFHSFIIILTAYSIVSLDLHCFISHHYLTLLGGIMNFIFIVFLTDILIRSVFMNNYVLSFLFWIDISSLISLAPEIPLLWSKIEHIM